MGFATELAIQLKDTLGFVVGLGGMYTAARSGFVTFVLSSKEVKALAADSGNVGLAAKRAQKRGQGAFIALVSLFVFAIFLYVDPLSPMDPRMLRAGTQHLTFWGAVAVYTLMTVAIGVFGLSLWIDALRQRLLDLVALSKK